MSWLDGKTALRDALALASRSPRQMLEFHFPTAGIVYVSDQELDNPITETYLPLVEDWGTLQDVVGDPATPDPGFVRQLSITLFNGGDTPFANYFIDDPPETVEVLLYQWAVGLDESEKALIDRFVIQDPIEYSEANPLMQLDLVGLPALWDMQIGTVLSKSDWPNADPADIGRHIPIPVGSPGQIPTLKAKVALACTLANSILAADTTIPVNEDLDEIGFPSSGSVQLGDELISFTSRTAGSLTGCTRGASGTEADQHLRNEEIVEHITDHTFLLCEGPVASIDNVLIDGYPAPAGSYSVDAASNPAKVVFNTQPYYERYSSGSKILEMQFDSVGALNTALNAANAFDVDETATSAKINNANSVLQLIQDTVNPDRGQILKAYLSVAHWESGNFTSDYVQVEISGIGVIGILSRPNPEDEVGLSGDVDVDHGHLHSTGAAHFHTYNEPDFDSNADPHDHSMSIDIAEISSAIGSFPIGEWITESSTDWTTDYITFQEYDNNQGVWVDYELDWYNSPYAEPDIELRIYVGGSWRTVPLSAPGGARVYIASGAVGGSPYIRYRSSSSSASTRFILSSCSIVFHAVNTIDEKTVAVTTDKTVSGSVLGQGADANDDPIKASDDVHDLAVGNRPLNLNSQENPSRTIVDKFDITGDVNFDWSWFTNRIITLTYISTGENKDVHVLHTYFQVEFAEKEIVFSDQVSAQVTASISNPAAVVEWLLTEKAAMAASLLDTSGTMATAESTFTDRGYSLDGLLEGDLSVRDAIKKICRQVHSRIYTSGGLVRMVIKEYTAQGSPPTIGDDDRQIRSLKVRRRPLREVINCVGLCYNFDWLGDAGFKDIEVSEDTDSVTAFGRRYNSSDFEFDLIRDQAMAQAVAYYYLRLLRRPSTICEVSFFLPMAANVEPETFVLSTIDFPGLESTNMIIRGVDRRFGSGKLKQGNLLQATLEWLH